MQNPAAETTPDDNVAPGDEEDPYLDEFDEDAAATKAGEATQAIETTKEGTKQDDTSGELQPQQGDTVVEDADDGDDDYADEFDEDTNEDHLAS